MVLYKCPRCGYNTTHRTHIINHLNRKNICLPTLEDISIEMICNMYNFEIPSNIAKNSTQTAPKKVLMDKNSTQKGAIRLADENIEKKQTNTKQCIYCNKIFTRKYGVTKHLKICKIKKNIDEKNLLDEKITEIELLKNKIINTNNTTNINNTTNNTNNTTNNTTNTTNNTTNINNITNNIIIKNYGDENIQLSNSYLNGLLKGVYGAIPKLIQIIHFNNKIPENSNIRITNKKLPYAEIRKNDKWEILDKEELIELLVDDKYYTLEDYYNEMDKSNLTEYQIDTIETFKNKYNSSNEELMKTLKKKTELVILNK